MEIKESRQNEGILFQVEGRVDTNTSIELQARILNGLQKSSVIMLDLKEVEYISSAGLRALLIGEKTAKAIRGRMEIHNVQAAVMEVLQMTGFDRILDITE